MYEVRRLRNHKGSQCKVIDEGHKITFVSYTTEVIKVLFEDGKKFVECTGTYSQTTRRQISWFLKEYFPEFNYYDMKEIAGKGVVEM